MTRVRLLMGTWLDGAHHEPGEELEVRYPLARLLVQANRAEILPAVVQTSAIGAAPERLDLPREALASIGTGGPLVEPQPQPPRRRR